MTEDPAADHLWASLYDEARPDYSETLFEDVVSLRGLCSRR